MSTQPTDAMIEAGIEAAEGQFWEYVTSEDVRTIYLAMQSARTPPPCAGDDVERAYKDGFCEGFEHRGKNDDQLAAITGAERGWTHRAAIAALGTTPSIVGGGGR